jgi:hypothetical protein
MQGGCSPLRKAIQGEDAGSARLRLAPVASNKIAANVFAGSQALRYRRPGLMPCCRRL